MEKQVALHPRPCLGILPLLTAGPQAGLDYTGALLERSPSAAFDNETSLEGGQHGLGLDWVSHPSGLMPQNPSEFVLGPLLSFPTELS